MKDSLYLNYGLPVSTIYRQGLCTEDVTDLFIRIPLRDRLIPHDGVLKSRPSVKAFVITDRDVLQDRTVANFTGFTNHAMIEKNVISNRTVVKHDTGIYRCVFSDCDRVSNTGLIEFPLNDALFSGNKDFLLFF